MHSYAIHQSTIVFNQNICEHAVVSSFRCGHEGIFHHVLMFHPLYFSLPFQGSDPRIATCRGKLQNKRCKLNQEINKELRLRAGAENLFKATTNRKLKDTVALELSFVNSNLQLLKEQLSSLNSSVEIYQNDRLVS